MARPRFVFHSHQINFSKNVQTELLPFDSAERGKGTRQGSHDAAPTDFRRGGGWCSPSRLQCASRPHTHCHCIIARVVFSSEGGGSNRIVPGVLPPLPLPKGVLGTNPLGHSSEMSAAPTETPHDSRYPLTALIQNRFIHVQGRRP